MSSFWSRQHSSAHTTILKCSKWSCESLVNSDSCGCLVAIVWRSIGSLVGFSLDAWESCQIRIRFTDSYQPHGCRVDIAWMSHELCIESVDSRASGTYLHNFSHGIHLHWRRIDESAKTTFLSKFAYTHEYCWWNSRIGCFIFQLFSLISMIFKQVDLLHILRIHRKFQLNRLTFDPSHFQFYGPPVWRSDSVPFFA